MGNKDSGFLKLYRTFFDHFLWDEDREFSKAEAWIDLLQTARYKEGISTEMINGQVVEWGRGELLASVRFLKKRWNWNSTGKVTRFLELLEKQNMVIRKTEQGVTVISICNYCSYNPIENDNGTVTERGQNRDRTETEQRQVQNSKNEKNVKNEKNIPPEISDVTEWLIENKNLSEPISEKVADEFYSFYEMKGWKVGKSKMKDWKIALGRSLKWDSIKSIIENQNGQMNGTKLRGL